MRQILFLEENVAKKESVTELIMEMFKLFVLLHAKKTEFGEKPKKLVVKVIDKVLGFWR